MNLPNNVEAERSFLSLLFKRPELIRQYDGVVRAEDFYRHSNALIYESIFRLIADNKPVSVVSLTEELKNRDELHNAGGIRELTAIQMLTDDMFTSDAAFLAKGYAEIIIECSRSRKGIREYETAAKRAAAGEDLETILADVQRNLQGAAHDLSNDVSDVSALVADWEEWYKVTKEKGECPGIASGFHFLDYLTGGFQKSTLIILGARPNMGKSALAINIAIQASIDNKSVAFFSLEMTKREVTSRILAAEGHIDARHTNIPALLTRDERETVKNVFKAMDKWKLKIDDSYALPVSQIAARARRLKNAGGLDLVIIDHLNYIGSEGKFENRTNEVRKITAALKGMAKELEVPVICLCQLSRGVESRSDKRPSLSDLRESGTIEQDADIVLLLYRDGYYTKDEADTLAELEVAKHRGGAVGVVNLLWDGVHQKFADAPYQGKTKKAKMEDIPQ